MSPSIAPHMSFGQAAESGSGGNCGSPSIKQYCLAGLTFDLSIENGMCSTQAIENGMCSTQAIENGSKDR